MKKERLYYTARHLLTALQQLDEEFLDLPLVLVHGKDLNKPNLVLGFVPAPAAVDREAVEAKKPSLLMLAEFTDLIKAKANGKAKSKSKSDGAKAKGGAGKGQGK